MQETFKQRVLKEIIKSAKEYKENLVDYEYLIYSSEFNVKKYYIISAKEDNFLHLTGVITNLKPIEFYNKCIDCTLTEEDFEIGDKIRKGTIRRKIGVLSNATKMFLCKTLQAQENFIKNKVCCSFASTDFNCTLGFTDNIKVKPKTLLKGNELKNPIKIELIMRKKIDDVDFNETLLNELQIDINEILKSCQ